MRKLLLMAGALVLVAGLSCDLFSLSRTFPVELHGKWSHSSPGYKAYRYTEDTQYESYYTNTGQLVEYGYTLRSLDEKNERYKTKSSQGFIYAALYHVSGDTLFLYISPDSDYPSSRPDLSSFGKYLREH